MQINTGEIDIEEICICGEKNNENFKLYNLEKEAHLETKKELYEMKIHKTHLDDDIKKVHENVEQLKKDLASAQNQCQKLEKNISELTNQLERDIETVPQNEDQDQNQNEERREGNFWYERIDILTIYAFCFLLILWQISRGRTTSREVNCISKLTKISDLLAHQ